MAIRKLEVCAHLLGDKDLQRWCTFHLGGYVYRLPRAPSELSSDCAEKVISKLVELKVPFDTEEIFPRFGTSGGGFESIEFIE
ncbi:MAG TPA: hypothetical protein VHM69_03135, partial [Rubrobacter sp.]|nr:hypothetical protein [Rubrobacter sp.]